VKLFEDSGKLSVLPAVEVQLAQLGHRLEPQPLVLRVPQSILQDNKDFFRLFREVNRVFRREKKTALISSEYITLVVKLKKLLTKSRIVALKWKSSNCRVHLLKAKLE
jgi:hypothetical protein